MNHLQFSATMHSAAVNMFECQWGGTCDHVYDIHVGIGLPGHGPWVYSALVDSARQFLSVALPCIPISSVFRLLPVLASPWGSVISSHIYERCGWGGGSILCGYHLELKLL